MGASPLLNMNAAATARRKLRALLTEPLDLGPFVRDTLQATIYPEKATIALDGKKVYLCHGDLIDAGDTGYRLYLGSRDF